MPNRIIRDRSRSSPTLAAASDFAERLFWRITTCMDDFGRFHGSPRVIMSECFQEGATGLSLQKVEAALEELERLDLVRSYDSDGRRYIYSPTWNKHQRVRATESKFPEPVDSKGRGHPRTSAVKRGHLLSSAAVIGNGNGNGNEKDQNQPRKTRAARSSDPPPGFLQFWQLYPRKAGKGAALRAWSRNRCEPLRDAIATAVKAQVQWPEGEGLNKHHDANGAGGNPHPSTWLNQERWEDEPPKSQEMPALAPLSPEETLHRARQRHAKAKPPGPA